MKKLLPFILICNLQSFAQPVYQWGWDFAPGAGTQKANGIALDGSGNFYLTGATSGVCDFDPGPGTANLTSAGGRDIYVAKYDAVGAYQWAFRIGNTSSSYHDVGNAIAVDGSGNVYVTGDFFGTGANSVDFDPGSGTALLNSPSASTAGAFLAKYDAAGAYQWAFKLGCATNANHGQGVSADTYGNCYVTGQFSCTADFDPGSGTANLTPSSWDIFVAKYNSAGSYQWAFNIGGSSMDKGYAIALDPSANYIYITGDIIGSVDADPGPGTANLTTGALYDDIFIGKYTTAGTYQWAINVGGQGSLEYDYGYAIAVDALGSAYVTGSFQGTNADFHQGASPTISSISTEDIFVAKYSSDGAYQWAFGIGESMVDKGNGIAIDAAGTSCYVTGAFSVSSSFFPMDFDPGPGVYPLADAGLGDAFVAQYDAATGGFQCAGTIGGTANDAGNAIAAGSSGNYYVAGYFTATADLDPGAGTASFTAPSSSIDAFLASYNGCAVLPIGLLSFAGRDDGVNNLLQWTTTSEVNNDYFIIEQGGDGNNFEAIGKVKGAGNTNSKYSFIDKNPLRGINYYRLKQVDYDGNFTYSKAISINNHQINKSTVSIYPIPSDKELNYEFYSEENSMINISVMDLLGNIVVQEQTKAKRGINKSEIDIERLPDGMYFLNVNNTQTKFIKQ